MTDFDKWLSFQNFPLCTGDTLNGCVLLITANQVSEACFIFSDQVHHSKFSTLLSSLIPFI